jgi:spermidine synthase
VAAAVASKSVCTVETNYYCIKVNELADSSGHSERLVSFDGIVQGIADLDEPGRLVMTYQQHYAAVLEALHPRRSRFDAFVVGGAAFSVARYLEQTYAGRVVVSEIDPGVVAVARHELGFPEPGSTRIEVVVDDARRVLSRLPRADRFGLIIGDAFAGATVPYQLTTREYAELLKGRLRPDGIYMLNVTDGADHAFLRSEVATLRRVFPYVALVKPDTGWPPSGKADGFVIVAAPRTPGVPLPTISPEALDQFVAAGPKTILTDDHVPVDQLLAPAIADIVGHR